MDNWICAKCGCAYSYILPSVAEGLTYCEYCAKSVPSLPHSHIKGHDFAVLLVLLGIFIGGIILGLIIGPSFNNLAPMVVIVSAVLGFVIGLAVGAKIASK